MQRIVFLTSRFPFPLDKGDKLRVYYQLRSLSNYAQVHLICIHDRAASTSELASIERFCSSVELCVLPKPRRLISLWKSLWNGLPLQIAYFFDTRIALQIKQLIADIQPDHIHCHLIRTTEYVRHQQDLSLSLDFMDAFAKGMEKREQNASNPFKKWLFGYEKKRLRRYESSVFDFVERFCIISEQDREAITHPENAKINIIPNGVDFDIFYPKKSVKQYDIVFMGNMSYPPNIAAVSFLVEEILPLIHAQRPQTTLLIAGIGAPANVKSFQNEQISVIEHFADISDSIAIAKIMLAPMLISIGLQNKIIQAMAMKVPCVISQSANRAIGARHQQEIMTAQTAAEFAAHSLDLLTQTTMHQQIAEAAYEFVKVQFDWEIQNQKLFDLFNLKKSQTEKPLKHNPN